jgi:hypothetical protein
LDFESYAKTELAKALAGASVRVCYEYVKIFRDRSTELAAQDQKEFALLFGLLAEVSSMWLDPRKSDSLGPLWEFNGQSSATPYNIKDEYIDLLAGLLPHLDDPELQARVADVLWLRKRDFRAGKQAIVSYLASAKLLRSSEDWEAHTFDRIERARSLAKALTDREGLQSIVEYVSQLILEFKDGLEANLSALLSLFRMLQRQGILSEKADEFAVLAEECAAIAQEKLDWHVTQMYWECAAVWYKITENEELRQKALIFAAECDVQQALNAANEIPPRYMAAHAFVEDAITALRRIGGQSARVEQLHAMLIEYGEKSLEQMQLLSVTVDFGPSIEKARNVVAGRSLQDALFVWAHLTSVVSLEGMRDEATKNINENPLRFLVSRRSLSRSGKTVWRASGESLDSDETVHEEMLSLVGIYHEAVVASTLGPALYQINLEHRIHAEEITHIVKNNPLVLSGHEEIYIRGLVAGLQGDNLIAAHLLFPQIEALLRELLVQTGNLTSSLNNDLIQDEYPLSTILYWPQLEAILGVDIVFNLKALLVERGGSNLRNLALHGLMEHNEFYSHKITYLVWLILKLLYMPMGSIRNNVSTDNEESATSPDTNTDTSQ